MSISRPEDPVTWGEHVDRIVRDQHSRAIAASVCAAAMWASRQTVVPTTCHAPVHLLLFLMCQAPAMLWCLLFFDSTQYPFCAINLLLLRSTTTPSDEVWLRYGPSRSDFPPTRGFWNPPTLPLSTSTCTVSLLSISTAGGGDLHRAIGLFKHADCSRASELSERESGRSSGYCSTHRCQPHPVAFGDRTPIPPLLRGLHEEVFRARRLAVSWMASGLIDNGCSPLRPSGRLGSHATSKSTRSRTPTAGILWLYSSLPQPWQIPRGWPSHCFCLHFVLAVHLNHALEWPFLHPLLPSSCVISSSQSSPLSIPRNEDCNRAVERRRGTNDAGRAWRSSFDRPRDHVE